MATYVKVVEIGPETDFKVSNHLFPRTLKCK
jgi:hypothetical protein